MFLLFFYTISVLPRLASDSTFSYLSLLNSEITMVHQNAGLVCDDFVTPGLIGLSFSSDPSYPSWWKMTLILRPPGILRSQAWPAKPGLYSTGDQNQSFMHARQTLHTEPHPQPSTVSHLSKFIAIVKWVDLGNSKILQYTYIPSLKLMWKVITEQLEHRKEF